MFPDRFEFSSQPKVSLGDPHAIAVVHLDAPGVAVTAKCLI
jgi:hypothetical protein